VEIRPSQSGIVDELRLAALELQLRELTDDPTSGDIVIDVAHVAVMTAGFISLLAVTRPRLNCQNRRLSLHGLRPECACVLAGTGLEDLCSVHQVAVEAAPRLRFETALTARPRGSGRAA
jgi:anti-anti-sigma regulatory factor